MCQMTAVVCEDGQERVVLENVTELEVKEEGLRLQTMFDEPRDLPGMAVTRIDFLAGRVYLAPADGARV